MTEVLTKGKTEVISETTTAVEDRSGWWCVRTNPYPCPCGQFTAEYMTCAHKIIVWPEIDHKRLLELCAFAKEHNRNPKVVEYQNDFGPCIAYDEILTNPNIRPHWG